MGFRARQVYFASLVLLSLTSSTVVASENDGEEESNPFFEAAKSLIQDQIQNNPNAQGFGAMGGMVASFLQSGGGKQLGDMLAGGGGKNNAAGDLLSGLGSLLTQPGDGDKPSPAADILSGLGSLLAQPGGGDMIGSVVSMFAGQDSTVDVNNNEVNGRKESGGIDLQAIMGLASTFMGQGNKQGAGMETIMNLLPVLMQGMGDSSGNDAVRQERSAKKPAGSFMPPFVEHLMGYWEHFKTSELGEALWKNSGLEAIMKLFTDETGKFDVDKVFRSLQNPSFRRRWIKSLTSFVAEWVTHVANPATQARYMSTAQYFGNSFLSSQGYAKFDSSRPAESLSNLANAVFKRQFGMKIEAKTYIKPAVAYLQDVFRMGQSKGLSLSHLAPGELESKMADTLNGEVIEPVLRVWRGFTFCREQPKCDRFVVCTLNEDGHVGGGLKPGVTKIATIAASWFMSSVTHTPFWKLYTAATEHVPCANYFESSCDGYHEFDIATTTEYIHNEL